MLLPSVAADEYSIQFNVPADLPSGQYTLRIYNGSGGAAGWRLAGEARIIRPVTIPPAVFSVLEPYGPEAVREMRKSVNKYIQPPDRTDGIMGALKKAKDNGGGTVYFPAGATRSKATGNS